MPQENSHIIFQCGHQQLRAVEPKKKTIRSKIKLWMHPKGKTFATLCSICEASTRRHAPPAKGTSQTIAAVALTSRGNSLPALRAVQIRWEEMATLTKSTKTKLVDEFSNDHQVVATEANRELEKIDHFWKETHFDHVANIPISGLTPGEWGPDACPLCEEALHAILDRPHQPNRLDCDCSDCTSKAVERAISKKGKDVQQYNGGAQSGALELRGRLSKRSTKRYQYYMSMHEKLSSITEDEGERISGLVPLLEESPGSQTGLWQSSQSQISSNEDEEIYQDDSTHPLLQIQNNSPDIPDFLQSENTLWRPKPRVSPQRISPDSVEGTATIQRIRNSLDFPDATPLQILSVRELPERFTDMEELLNFEKDVLSVAWKKEGEEAAKAAKTTKLHPESFDGVRTMLRIKYRLELTDSATTADILSVPKLPNSLTNSNNLKSFAADVDSIAWKDEDNLQARKLVEMATANLATIPLPLSHLPLVEMKKDANQSTEDLISF